MLGWLTSLLVATLTGAAGLFLAGYVAVLCVTWYQIPSREGASGYFVVLIGLAGGVLSGVVGFIIARVIAHWWQPGLWYELSGALSAQLVVFGLALAICRALADVPPTLDGHELTLELEFRLPEGEAPVVDAQGQLLSERWTITLGALSVQTLRCSQTGTVPSQRPGIDGTRAIISAHVPIFTSRGARLVTLAYRPPTDADAQPSGLDTDYTPLGRVLHATSSDSVGFLVPLAPWPDRTHLQWSEWLPRQLADGTPWPANQTSYRFRVRCALD